MIYGRTAWTAKDLHYYIKSFGISCTLYHFAGGPFMESRIADRAGLSAATL